MAKTGKAWVMYEPGRMGIEEFPYPTVKKDGIVVRIDAVGICGSDKHMFLGNGAVAHFPLIPGHEMCGTIEQLGSEYKEHMMIIGGDTLREGDRVILGPGTKACGVCDTCLKYPDNPTFCQNRFRYGHESCRNEPHFLGGFGQYLYVMPNSWLFQMPDTMSPILGAMAEPVCIALRFVERCYNPGSPGLGKGLGTGRTVTVIGCGPIGLLTIAVLKHAGAGNIIAVDVVDDKLKTAETFGADASIDGKLPMEERLERIRQLNHGELSDIVIEAAGVPAAFQDSLEYVRRGGMVIEGGHFTDGGPASVNPFTITYKEADIRGVWASHPVTTRDAINFMERSAIPIENMATHILPFDQAEKGMNLAGNPGVGKVIIKPWE